MSDEIKEVIETPEVSEVEVPTEEVETVEPEVEPTEPEVASS